MEIDSKYIDTEIIQKFRLESPFVGKELFGNGFINDSYLITTEDENLKYVLQRINHSVFKNVEGLMSNMHAVTSYIAKKDKNANCLRVIPTLDNKNYFKDSGNNYWRILNYIPESHSFEKADVNRAFQGGQAFGNFQKMLSNFPVSTLIETIPDFHNLAIRTRQFLDALDKNKINRTKRAKKEINMIIDRMERMNHFHEIIITQNIPKRITHNDTKLNNVLFNKKGEAICVIDLDTVMPGYVFSDFGDSIRSFTNTGQEDDKNLSNISMDIDIFEAYAKGFLQEVKNKLTEVELENLAFSALHITYMQVLRFLTDYLNGDTYYKIQYPEHNLARTKAQLKLLISMEEQYEQMKSTILNVVS